MWQPPGAIAAEHSSALAAAKFRVLFCFYEPNFVRRNEPLMQVGEGQPAPGNPVAGGGERGCSSLVSPSPFLRFVSPSSHYRLGQVTNPSQQRPGDCPAEAFLLQSLQLRQLPPTHGKIWIPQEWQAKRIPQPSQTQRRSGQMMSA